MHTTVIADSFIWKLHHLKCWTFRAGRKPCALWAWASKEIFSRPVHIIWL